MLIGFLPGKRGGGMGMWHFWEVCVTRFKQGVRETLVNLCFHIPRFSTHP